MTAVAFWYELERCKYALSHVKDYLLLAGYAIVDKSDFMDNIANTSSEASLCAVFYCSISRQPIDDATRLRAIEHWAKITKTPWTQDDQRAQAAYGAGFFRDVHQSTAMQTLRKRWSKHFNNHGHPLCSCPYNEFLAEFISTLLHCPRDYQSFSCVNPSVRDGHPMDCAIDHPITIDHWAVYVSWAGGGQVSYQQQGIALPANTVAIVPPGCHCRVQRAAPQAYWNFSLLTFPAQPAWLAVLDWAFSVHRPLVLNCQTSTDLGRLRANLNELAITPYQRGDTAEKLCQNLIENGLMRLRRIYEQDAGRVINQADWHIPDKRLLKAANYVLDHYREELKLADVAGIAGLSPGRLNELFKKQHATTVMAWRDGIRLSKASELLRHTELSVSAVSLEVGWSDPLYFSRRFKQAYGQSPKSYRLSRVR